MTRMWIPGMDSYEDMFKEITRKLYGDEEMEGMIQDYEGLVNGSGGNVGAAIVTSVTQVKQEEDRWVASEESLPWTQSKIASYNSAQKLFRCHECECVGFLSRVAEHWLGTHANLRVFQCPQCPYASAWARCVRMHLARQHNICPEQSVDPMATFWKENPVLEEVTKFLQRLKTKVESEPPPPVIKQEVLEFTVPVLQTPTPTRHSTENSTPTTPKRYNCSYCPYATDRRDLYTRHENIHREEKPFHCYMCQKQFNRADHVKKHFVRMHRDVAYDINRIRREVSKEQFYPKVERGTQVSPPRPAPTPNPTLAPAVHGLNIPGYRQQKAQRRKPGEKRYSCCYCSWSGVDNWCLKRHLNTHLKPYTCSLCEYKAARSERLATHVAKVHNKKACSRCSYMADDQTQLTIHLQQQHHVSPGGNTSSVDYLLPPKPNEPIFGQFQKLDPILNHTMKAPGQFQQHKNDNGIFLPMMCSIELDSLGENSLLDKSSQFFLQPRCGICGFETETQTAMVAHLDKHSHSIFNSELVISPTPKDKLDIIPVQSKESCCKPFANKKPFKYSLISLKLWRKYGTHLLTRKRYYCCFCPMKNRLYFSKSALVFHHLWAHGKGSIKCEKCNQGFKYRYQLHLHKTQSHSKLTRQQAKKSILMLTTTSLHVKTLVRTNYHNSILEASYEKESRKATS